MASVAPPCVKATANNRFAAFFCESAILVSADGAVGLLTVVIEPPLPLPLCSPALVSIANFSMLSLMGSHFRCNSALLVVSQGRFRCNSARLVLSHHNTASVQPAQLLCPGSRRRHTTASMEPTQITLAVMSIVNTSRIIMQYMQNQNLQKQVTMNDNTLLRITQRDKEWMLLECQQTLGPHAAMLSYAMNPDYVLLAWCGKVSYHGGHNKVAVPRNLL
ncbi:hypothetical protein UY3_17047 [Chelonia mydas]|uniref:Uncharacterized protein n=1 Tax=Chelonia mydas TaxID=8469 RepID=M7AMZ7_CHEMY|nr:hypothetical protein UY3_17047 [Chelonia mydas]